MYFGDLEQPVNVRRADEIFETRYIKGEETGDQ
jgi:hypothetical protein